MGGREPLCAGSGVEVQPVFWLEAQVLQSGSDFQAHALEVVEALELIWAKLVVLPVLVNFCLLAVNHLLDLLRLGMHIDNLAGADRLCVSESLR